MCFDGSSEDGGSENGGYISFADMFDGGGPGRSGARFSGGDTSVLDSNNDNYVSEAEYMRGQLASEANEDRGRGGTFGDAYNQAQTGVSKFSNAFGALPRGSIASEAALGSEGTDIKTDGLARVMQGGGVLGAIGRGLTGGNIMSPEYVSPDQGDMTRDEYDRAIVKSFNSMGNTGEEPVPPEVAAAMGRVRGLNPRAVSVPAPVLETLYYDDDPYSNQITKANPKDKVVFENGVYNFYENGQLVRTITEQEYNQMLMNPYRTA
tara:strand:- start:2509 stop:3300 length:792 start_codon:yes stop_codon:yes gene_type:complete